jgi:hypothetical protein
VRASFARFWLCAFLPAVMAATRRRTVPRFANFPSHRRNARARMQRGPQLIGDPLLISGADRHSFAPRAACVVRFRYNSRRGDAENPHVNR